MRKESVWKHVMGISGFDALKKYLGLQSVTQIFSLFRLFTHNSRPQNGSLQKYARRKMKKKAL